MAHKRSRNLFENDLTFSGTSFVAYGTALAPLDGETRDDGSYVPIWKQEVTDERGRKRLHGAFTGGYSAGYFNTVGSKEGWTPSTFVSSRTNRRKDDEKKAEQRPEDFMDEEDLAEAAEAQKLQTTDAFSGLGSTGEDEKRKDFLLDLLKTEGETMGVKLLRKMGWRDGQGIGPRVRRKAQLSDDRDLDQDDQDEHLFTPVNSKMISFSRKNDRKGLGFAGEGRLASVSAEQSHGPHSDNEEDVEGAFHVGVSVEKKKATKGPKVQKGGFGVGVLNDLGSDDDDPYEMGPRISYNRVIGGDKKKAKVKAPKAKSQSQAANPLLSTKPVFISKKATSLGFRKCYDGRLPLAGFVLFDFPKHTSSLLEDERWPRPQIPLDWKSSKISTSTATATETPTDTPAYKSTADVARASQLNPKARAAILGEAQLPGKSIFDFLSPAARDRLATASGKTNLPAALGEAPPRSHDTTSATTSFPKSSTPTSRPSFTSIEIPDLDKDIALAALGRGVGGWTPYADDPAKLSRYRDFLEYRGGVTASLPSTPHTTNVPRDAWIQELREFAHAAQVFRPMTGMMASRFTSSTAAPTPFTARDDESADPDDPDKPILLQTPATTALKKAEDPAEAAARMGMFGPLTRSVTTFYPTRMVCKRFGVKPPANVQPDASASGAVPSFSGNGGTFGSRHPSAPADLVSKKAMDEMMREAAIARPSFVSAGVEEIGKRGGGGGDSSTGNDVQEEARSVGVVVDAERNEALEGQRAGDAVFKAIFGSDDEG